MVWRGVVLRQRQNSELEARIKKNDNKELARIGERINTTYVIVVPIFCLFLIHQLEESVACDALLLLVRM